MLQDPSHPTRSVPAGSSKRCSDPTVPPHTVFLTQAACEGPGAPHGHGPGWSLPCTRPGRWEHRAQHLQNTRGHPRAALILTGHRPWQEPLDPCSKHQPRAQLLNPP